MFFIISISSINTTNKLISFWSACIFNIISNI